MQVYSGLKVVSSFANAPVALLLSQPLLRPSDSSLKLQVKTILGQPVSDGASVTIERVTLPAQGKEFESYRDRSFKGSADGTFTGRQQGGGPPPHTPDRQTDTTHLTLSCCCSSSSSSSHLTD